ncbi:maleylpyruvate isomerase family mycothiol-dependent enzyme [Nonomuraea solani]|nr:maleylpyruvate isomerase family mycothiol-dependent enzyme [Nonomuraea solani]
MTVLPALQAELAAATDRLLATAASLSDTDIAAPSLLPGWTRGHVLAHLAGNARSHLNLLTWARTGTKTPQYSSYEARATEIAAHATRPAARLLAELGEEAARLATAIRDLPEDRWSAPVEAMRPPPHPAWYILVRRLREVGLHHVDLDAGHTPADWPASFVRRELHDCLACWPYDRSTISEVIIKEGTRTIAEWHNLGTGPGVTGAPADMLAWLTGRSDGKGVSLLPVGQSLPPRPGPADLPDPPPWQTMPAPADLPMTPPKDYS